MLLYSLDQLQTDPFRAIVSLATFTLVLLISLSFHEFCHALAATTLGDPTARNLGRLSLHPRAHLDPVGTTMIFIAGFGWAKPVPVNAMALRLPPRQGMATVALAGPLANVALATLFAILLRTGLVTPVFLGFDLFRGQPDDVLGYVVVSVVFWNLLLAAFNLIPIAPLDGFKVALGVLPRHLAFSFSQLERHGPMILMLLILFSILLPGPGILFNIIRPIVNALSIIILGRQVM